MRPFPRAVTTSYLFITAVFIIIINSSLILLLILLLLLKVLIIVTWFQHTSTDPMVFCMITFCFSVADADVTGDFVM